MSAQDLIGIGKSLHQTALPFSVEDFKRGVELLGGKKATYLYILPLRTRPYCAVFKRFIDSYSIELGKFENPNASLPTMIDLNSEEGKLMIGQLADSAQGLINYFSHFSSQLPMPSEPKIIKATNNVPVVKPMTLRLWLYENAHDKTFTEICSEMPDYLVNRFFGRWGGKMQTEDKIKTQQELDVLRNERLYDFEDGRYRKLD